MIVQMFQINVIREYSADGEVVYFVVSLFFARFFDRSYLIGTSPSLIFAFINYNI